MGVLRFVKPQDSISNVGSEHSLPQSSRNTMFDGNGVSIVRAEGAKGVFDNQLVLI